MGTGAFFQHCHSKTQKHTQHRMYSTSRHVRITSVDSWSCLKHILCSCFYCLQPGLDLPGLCFWKKRPTWTYTTFCRCWANSRLERWAADFSVFQLLLQQKCNIKTSRLDYCGSLTATIFVFESGKLREHVTGWGDWLIINHVTETGCAKVQESTRKVLSLFTFSTKSTFHSVDTQHLKFSVTLISDIPS